MNNNILICFVNMNQYDGKFEDLSDEEVFRLADENHRCYTLKGFETCFNDSVEFLHDAHMSLVRIIEVKDN